MKLSYNNKQHAYWLNGKRCKSVTAVAKILDDTFRLEKWQQRQVAIGLASSPPLVERAAAHFDDRDTLDQIVEEAHVAAKAHEASGRGTAAHRVTERIDLSLTWIDTPMSRAIAQQWTRALDQAGLDIVPELVERIIIHPDQLIAGRFDRIARRRSDNRLVGVDIKTGTGAVRYPHSTAIQLGLYFNAPLMAGPIAGESGATETFEPLPADLDHTTAYVIYLPAEGDGEVYEFDIAAGWDIARTVCFPILDWRRRDDLTRLVNIPNLAPPAASPERRTWLTGRIRAIVDAGHEPALAGLWDLTAVPAPITAATALTDTQIDTAAAWCDQIEAVYELPFGTVDPAFAPFAVADQPPEPAPPTPGPVVEARNELARHWADKGRALLAELDPPEQAAVLTAAAMTGAETMDADLYTRLEAIVTQATAAGGGAVEFAYEAAGPRVVVTGQAEALMAAAAGSRGEARDRAARAAKQMGRIAPRSLAKAAQNPLLAALVASGHGGVNTPTSNQENNTT